jgi:type II secretory pathway component PulF
MEFRAEFLDRHGTTHRKALSAPDRTAAVQQLRDGHAEFILNLRRSYPFESLFEKLRSTGKPRSIRPAHLQAFSRALGAYLKAGISVQEALRLVGAADKTLYDLSENVRSRLANGLSMDVALVESGYDFPPTFLALIRAGSETGTLPDVLSLEARRLQTTLTIRRDLVASLIYPVALLLLCGLVILFMLGSIVPQLKAVMSDDVLDRAPLLSRAVFSASDLVTGMPGWAWFAFPILIGTAGSFLIRRWQGELTRFLLGMPLIGSILRSLASSSFCFALGTMMTASVRMEQAWRLALGGITIKALRDDLASAGQKIVEGASAAAALAGTRTLPDDVAALFALGERTGTLPALLLDAAEFHAGEALNRLQKLAGLIAPILILIAGLIVGGFAVAMMTTILSVNQIQGG